MAEAVTVIVQAYKFALDPTPTQAQALASHCGASRVAYNVMLAAVKANSGQRAAEKSYGVLEEDLTPAMGWSAYSLRRNWNGRKALAAPWWGENSKESYAGGCANLAVALSNWSKSRKGDRRGPKMGFPKFKSKHRSTPSCTFTTGAIHVESDRHHVTLPVVGTLKTHESTRKLARRLEAGTARIGSATVRFERGRWFVSFVAHVDRTLARPSHTKASAGVVGVDVGVKDLIVVATPDGAEISRVTAPKYLKAGKRKMLALQRKAARHVGPYDRETKTHREPSTGWRTTQIQIGAAHARVTNLRLDHLHKTTTALAQTHHSIVIETLAVRGMARAGGAHKKGLNRSLAEASFGTIARLLDYKTEWYGSKLVKADRWFPSSKTCSGCGQVKTKLALSEREFVCTSCGVVLDRDLNAAINLARLALTESTAGLIPATGGSGSLDIGGADGKTGVRTQVPDPARGREAETQLAGTVCPQGEAA